jgi:redox-sensing transcriptional repressor
MPKGTDHTTADHPPPRNGSEPRLSRASVGRLSLYLRRLEGLLREGTTRISSSLLGDAIGVTDAQVRKDLAPLGNLGHPGIGYDVAELIAAIRRVLGIDREWRAALVGVGNLARALLGYQGFLERGFQIVALFDADPGKIGQQFNNLPVHSMDRMPTVIPAVQAELGILTVPGEKGQSVADALVAAGVKGLLNFAPGVLRVPAGVSIVSVDLTVQLEQLAFLVQVAHLGRES